MESKKDVEIAKNIVINILSSGKPTPYSISDMYDIIRGDTDLLLEHLQALKNIFEKAIDELTVIKNERKKDGK